MTDTAVDLSRYVAGRQTAGLTAIWWEYEFPNGRRVDVSLDPHPTRTLRFVVEADGEELEPGLTTDEVEARLNEIRNLPPAEGEPAEQGENECSYCGSVHHDFVPCQTTEG